MEKFSRKLAQQKSVIRGTSFEPEFSNVQGADESKKFYRYRNVKLIFRYMFRHRWETFSEVWSPFVSDELSSEH